jgi:hypothetical protein
MEEQGAVPCSYSSCVCKELQFTCVSAPGLICSELRVGWYSRCYAQPSMDRAMLTSLSLGSVFGVQDYVLGCVEWVCVVFVGS